jgi:hypothetical protein
LSVRRDENPASNPEILANYVLKELLRKAEVFSLSVSVMDLHMAIRTFSAGVRLSKIAHYLGESVHNRICRLLRPNPYALLRLVPRF